MKNVLISGIANLVMDKMQEKEKCVSCHKKFKTYKKCYRPFKRGKGKKAFTSMRIAPNIYVGKLTSHHNPYVLCDRCSMDVLRFIGVIPDKHESKKFPQLHTGPMDPEQFFLELDGKKRTQWKLDYRSAYKSAPNKKGLYNKLLFQACIEYCRRHVTPYTPKGLMRVIKSHKNIPLEW